MACGFCLRLWVCELKNSNHSDKLTKCTVMKLQSSEFRHHVNCRYTPMFLRGVLPPSECWKRLCVYMINNCRTSRNMYIICPMYAQAFKIVHFCTMGGRRCFTESEAARESSFHFQGKECVAICRRRLIDKLDCIKIILCRR